ncbi:MAG: hypothetical protein KDB00_25780 [Planctomycetales bacterium]|nr:hypothetical protein [Planctomycetales bacterium]
MSVLTMSLTAIFAVQAVVQGDGPLPKFTYAGVVLQPENLKIAPASELERASIIKMEGRVQNPLGRYYLYYSPHKHVGISLAFSDNIIPRSEIAIEAVSSIEMVKRCICSLAEAMIHGGLSTRLPTLQTLMRRNRRQRETLARHHHALLDMEKFDSRSASATQ